MFQPLPTASMSAGQLFADPHQFSVPIYQRPYSWSVDEAARLLDDVAYAAGLDDGRPIDTDYFLGAILLLGNAAGGQSGELVHRLEIVDGQQRMVTLTILASALRDLEPQPTTETARRLDGLVRSAFGDLGAASRLELSGTDRDFFAAYVQDQGSCARIGPDNTQHMGVGQRAVLDARDRLVTELAQFTIEQRAELANYICDKCHFVVVITSDIDRAHCIFMVLNDRGRPLQRKDILNAEILKAVDPPFRGQALRIWSDAERQLGDEMENFFSQHRLRVRPSAGYRGCAQPRPRFWRRSSVPRRCLRTARLGLRFDPFSNQYVLTDTGGVTPPAGESPTAQGPRVGSGCVACLEPGFRSRPGPILPGRN